MNVCLCKLLLLNKFIKETEEKYLYVCIGAVCDAMSVKVKDGTIYLLYIATLGHRLDYTQSCHQFAGFEFNRVPWAYRPLDLMPDSQ